MELSEMSIEELVNDFLSFEGVLTPLGKERKAELLSRLTKGRAAIEAMEKIRQAANNEDYDNYEFRAFVKAIA